MSDDRIGIFTPPEEAALPIDAELIRVIAPGATDDHAGLLAMRPLTAAGNSNVHFLAPLPPGMTSDSAELFGFFTYELRVGHANVWSTAQGRFGRALRVTGVQHPAPTLFCTCERTQNGLIVEAPYLIAVLNGKNVTHDPPRTELWALLYAQVKQADGKDFRNMLLEDRKLRLARRNQSKLELPRDRGHRLREQRCGGQGGGGVGAGRHPADARESGAARGLAAQRRLCRDDADVAVAQGRAVAVAIQPRRSCGEPGR